MSFSAGSTRFSRETYEEDAGNLDRIRTSLQVNATMLRSPKHLRSHKSPAPGSPDIMPLTCPDEVLGTCNAEMVAEDCELRLRGYEVYRFGGAELTEGPVTSRRLAAFFDRLTERYSA